MSQIRKRKESFWNKTNHFRSLENEIRSLETFNRSIEDEIWFEGDWRSTRSATEKIVESPKSKM